MTRPRKKSRRKRESNPGSSALEADALTTRPTRRLHGSTSAVRQWRALGQVSKCADSNGHWGNKSGYSTLLKYVLSIDGLSESWLKSGNVFKFVTVVMALTLSVFSRAVTDLDRLVGLVVKVSASRAEDPRFESRLRRDISASSVTSDLKMVTPVATLPGARRYWVSVGTGCTGVSIL